MSAGARTRKWSAALLLVLAAGPLTADAQGTGSTVMGAVPVTVVVLDGEGTGVADVEITLEVHDGGQEVGQYQARSDSAGLARWDDIPAGAGVHAQVSASFDGVVYTSEVTTLAPDSAPRIEVLVFPVTSEGSPIHTEMLHLIVHAREPGVYQVAQVMRVQNLGEQAWIGGPHTESGAGAGIVIPIPVGARNVAAIPPPEGGLDPALTQFHDDHVLDLRPMPPGVRQVAVSYELTAGRGGVDVTFPLGYPTQSVSLLLGGPGAEGIEVVADTLQPQPAESIGGESFSRWTADAMGADDFVSFTLSTASESPWSAQTWALLCLAAGIILPVIASVVGGAGSAHIARLEDNLVQEIAQLDLMHDSQDIDDTDYIARRGHALEILETLDGYADDGG